MTRADRDERAELELMKIATLTAMTDAWAGRGVVSVDLSTGKVEVARRAEPAVAKP